jgi:hypothetical protein
MVKVMFTSLPVPFFREFIFKTNLMRNQEKPFRIWNKLSLVRAQAQLQLASKKTGNEIWPNVNWKFNLSIYVNLCLFDSSISDT